MDVQTTWRRTCPWWGQQCLSPSWGTIMTVPMFFVAHSVMYWPYMQVYLKVNPEYDGRITVPVLWDKQTSTIVNNESAEIIRMFNSEFNAIAKNPELDLYPAELQKQIDEMNEFVYPNINDGVYKCGFAKSQSACTYPSLHLFWVHILSIIADEDAFDKLFTALDKVEEIFSKQRYSFYLWHRIVHTHLFQIPRGRQVNWSRCPSFHNPDKIWCCIRR